MRFQVILNEEAKEIEVFRRGDRLQIGYDGKAYSARLIHQDGAHYVLEVEEPDDNGFINRKRIRAAGYRDGDSRQLWANGRLVDYRRIQEGTEQTPDTSDSSLSVSIPAVVSEILVKVGQQVKTGEKLILLESMKMILPIHAPFDGTIQSINCTPGEAVQPGLQLIDLSQIA